MKFVFGRQDWNTLRRGQEKCYLLTNEKGGYSSLTMIGSSARQEQVLLMASVKAPNNWVQMVSNVEELIHREGKTVSLLSQEYAGYAHNQEGFHHLQGFEMNVFPHWTYQVQGFRLEKTILLAHGGNQVALDYVLHNGGEEPVVVDLKPWLRMTPKGELPKIGEKGNVTASEIHRHGQTLYFACDGELLRDEETWQEDLYFQDDAKDDRAAVGKAFSDHRFRYRLEKGETRRVSLIYSTEPVTASVETLRREELQRQKYLQDQAGITSALGRQLVRAADQFVVDRESTGGKTIIAGYPFFGDWGRDTMIALLGCGIAAGRKADCESIFRTFMAYAHQGLMPNMFPEGDKPPMYNTVDASLLFIYALHAYYKEFKDLDFVREALPVMAEILHWYQKGTDFHIRMDEDGLLEAGGGFEQVTWMDVRIGDVLPTPRHGKPVEINAYWYNALMTMAHFERLLEGEDRAKDYENLAGRVKKSFLEKFWNGEKGCLYDVVSGNPYDAQVRPNQIWAVSLPFGMLDPQREKQVVRKVFEELYTPYGLRSLSPKDPEFKPFYGGSLWDRDTAYHQGTVWAFPLGAYYLAYLKVHGFTAKAAAAVMADLSMLEGTLQEGCIGQIAEIFDGLAPTVSKGCFAQAWSVGELLRALKAAEEILRKQTAEALAEKEV